MYTFEIMTDWRGDFTWRLINDIGHVLATSLDIYASYDSARAALEGLQGELGAASIAPARQAA